MQKKSAAAVNSRLRQAFAVLRNRICVFFDIKPIKAANCAVCRPFFGIYYIRKYRQLYIRLQVLAAIVPYFRMPMDYLHIFFQNMCI